MLLPLRRERKTIKATSFARELYGHLFDFGIKATKLVLKIGLDDVT